MAKKKTARRKAAPAAEFDGSESSSFWRGAGAILIIIAGIIVLFGAFIGNAVPKGMWNGAWWIFGAGAILVPPVLVYFGVLKFTSPGQRIPLQRTVSVLGSLVLLAAWLHTTFLHTDTANGTSDLIGGHGGQAGKLVGGVLAGALGQILASILLFALTLIAILLTFRIPPHKLLSIFKQKNDGENEDLGELKKRMGGLKLNEGVPVEHHGPEKASARLSSFRNSAQKAVPAESAEALTTASDPDWQFPPLDLLSQKQDKADAGNVQANADIIKDTFAQFNYEVEVEGANIGPRVTQFTLRPPEGVKMDKIESLDKNLAYSLEAQSIRIEAPIPGKRAVGIEVPNKKSATVTLHSVLASAAWREVRSPLAFAVGKDISGTPVVADLEDMPHVLIAGQTKAGKSVMINSVLGSLLYRNSPSELKLILIDPKHVEMAPYEEIPHLLAPVINEPEKCISALKWAVAEMDRRLRAFAELKQRDIQGYNSLKKEEGMPYVVIVIDELADLMMVAAREVEALVVRIAQKARAAGIHLVLATQRPSVDIITGLIKANVPGRIAFTVVSNVDSRTVIDQMGAEKLLGKGDMLFKTSDTPKPKRMQGALITGAETNKLCDFLRAQRGPDYNQDVISQPVQLNGRGGIVANIGSDGRQTDDKWESAVQLVIDGRRASTALLQRKLGLGYGRAAKLLDMMEEQGIVSASDGSNRPREVLVSSMSQVFGRGEDGDVYDDIPDENPVV